MNRNAPQAQEVQARDTGRHRAQKERYTRIKETLPHILNTVRKMCRLVVEAPANM